MRSMTRYRTFLLWTIFLLVFALAAGCATKKESLKNEEGKGTKSSTYPLEFTDGAGNVVVIAKKPERIISLAPSHTEILYGLGLGDKIVGVTQYCDYPKEALDKPKVGDSFTVNVERLLELQPDMVIQYWGMDDSLKKQLEEAGIVLLTFAPQSIEQVKNAIMQIGVATDAEEGARRLVDGMEQKEKEIAEKIDGLPKDQPKPKVFYEIEYSSALWTAGKGSFIDELIRLSGGENIASDAAGAYAQYSMEALIEKDPEIYITNTFNMNLAGAMDIQKRPGFQNITAVRNNRIEILDGNILSRPSQRVVEALELMAKAIHPELFQ
ncbi:ABC transporter substrate-binding protein [Thermotalea metallivorans]|uniref:Vitamin B12-binding protein n=1 Tax=Thermotalea metallivorans TaxID=520762 RepID=A0A140LEE8_9FIRM|nr:ABC transporter substrate-binding protein [Thermotalea metallivorans]KXG78923.1 Vitamin B12-binding protein [Thermotalea metallivorans]